jgi:hypothetical protein
MSHSCLICKSSTHETRECRSNHALEIDKEVSDWVTDTFFDLYNTSKYRIDILWISQSCHLTRLTKGDLLFLNQHTCMDDPMYVKEKLIYIYLHYSLWTFYQLYHIRFSAKVKKFIQVDIGFWYRLSNNIHTVEEARRIRIIELNPPYRMIQQKTTQEKIDCPVCLDEDIIKKNTHQYDCRHSICLKCSDTLLCRDTLTCPLCRADIKTVVEFIL